jgi:hypothetical protein
MRIIIAPSGNKMPRGRYVGGPDSLFDVMNFVWSKFEASRGVLTPEMKT